MVHKYYSIYIDKYTGVLGICARPKKGVPMSKMLLLLIDWTVEQSTYEQVASENVVELGWAPGYSIEQAWTKVPRSFHDLSKEARQHSELLSRRPQSAPTAGRSLIEDRISMDGFGCDSSGPTSSKW